MLTTVLVQSGLLTHLYDLADDLAARGVFVCLAVPRNRFRRGKHLLGRLKRFPICKFDSSGDLARFARRYKVDLIHVHSSRIFHCAQKVAKRRKIPLVVTLHGALPWLKRYPLTLAYARRVIAVGPAQASGVQEKYPNKVSLIPNGIDLDRFKPAERWRAGDSGPLKVLWFGRVSGVLSDGVAALDQAVHQLRKAGRNIEMGALGRIRGISLVHLEHHRWTDDPVPYLQNSHVVFGHGRALREAMACGNVGILLGHRYGGILRNDWFRTRGHIMGALPEYEFLPKPDPDILAAEIARLDDDRMFLERLRREAAENAKIHFDGRKMVDAIYQEYVKALGDGA